MDITQLHRKRAHDVTTKRKLEREKFRTHKQMEALRVRMQLLEHELSKPTEKHP